jgi:hypothetical protein
MVLSGLWVDTNGRFLGADGAVPLKVCPAGEWNPNSFELLFSFWASLSSFGASLNINS